jgi:hypothetical protein
MPEVTLEEYVFAPTTEAALPAGRAGNLRAPIPKPTEFAVNLKGYIGKVAGTCPLCGHTEIEEEGGNEESD